MEEKSFRVEMATEDAPRGRFYFANLDLPAKDYEILDAHQRARSFTAAAGYQDIVITRCDTLPQLTDVRLDCPTMEELNFLASRLEGLSMEEQIVLQAVFQKHQEAGEFDDVASMKDLINMTYGLDQVCIIGGVWNDSDLGRFVIDNEMDDDIAAMPQAAVDLLDAESVGRKFRMGEGGIFTNNHYVPTATYEMPEIYEHDGIVMTQILSLRRKDAARLGYDKGEAWRDLIRGKATDMAKAMNIPVQDLRWYAAFHNEGHHPHCHIVAYSVGKQPYMTEQALIHLKSSFAKEIFEQDLIQIYQEQTEYRDALRIDAKDLVAQIVAEINSGTYQNEVVEAMLRELAMRLRNTKGKKVYGYLSTPARNLVNGIIDELAKDSRISELYDLWYEQRDKVVQMYQTAGDDRVPLSQNKTFHPIRNVVVTEALKLLPEDSVLDEVAEEKLPEKEDVPPVVQNADLGETGSEVSVAKQLAEKLEKESTATDESSKDSRWQFANRNRSNPYLAMTCARLVANIAQIIQEDIEKEQKQLNLIDRKLRRKIAEKKQLHGQRMG